MLLICVSMLTSDSLIFIHYNNADVKDVSVSLVGVVVKTWKAIYQLYQRHSQVKRLSVRRNCACRVNEPKIPEYFVYSAAGGHANTKESDLGVVVFGGRNRCVLRGPIVKHFLWLESTHIIMFVLGIVKF